MHRRTKALAIPPKVKAQVWDRDLHRCVLCGSPYAFPDAHYISRAQGGLGIPENVVTLCRPCHDRYDNSPDARNCGPYWPNTLRHGTQTGMSRI